MADKNAILMDRDAGMKYREIAQKHNVSYQYVKQVCGKCQPNKFQFVREEACVYPNWRAWMNEEKVSMAELIRRMGLSSSGVNYDALRKCMIGQYQPKKPYIDKLLAITGMTYEKLFAEE